MLHYVIAIMLSFVMNVKIYYSKHSAFLSDIETINMLWDYTPHLFSSCVKTTVIEIKYHKIHERIKSKDLIFH